MADLPDWTTYGLAAFVLALVLWFLWFVGKTLLHDGRKLIDTIQNWPQIRRAMVDAEARSPRGRYPLWFRLVRVFLIVAMIGLMVLVVWRKFG